MDAKEFTALTVELIALAQSSATHHRERPGYSYLGPSRALSMRLGQRLDALGGMMAMRLAHRAVKQDLGPEAARELEMAWDGVGKWVD